MRKRPFFLENLRDQILVERIDNVESVTSGLFAALLKYGDVRMSLVGADEPKLFVKVPRPREIQQEISRRQHYKSLRRARFDAMQQRKILGEFIGDSLDSPAHAPPADAAPALNHDGGVRAVNNPDRNRPPRLPRKLVAAQRPAPPPRLSQPSQRRPQRLRPSATDSRKS